MTQTLKTDGLVLPYRRRFAFCSASLTAFTPSRLVSRLIAMSASSRPNSAS